MPDPIPQVSVIIPAFNTAEVIGNCVESVLGQSFRDFEIIVINDGSLDTPQLEQALEPYSTRIRYVVQENRGPSAARNRGILEARGEYVAFLDSDDVWFPEYLSTQISKLRKNPELGLIYSDSLLIRNGVRVGRTFEREDQALPVTFEALLQEECTVSTSTTVALRKAVLDAGLFDEQFKRCEDFDLWLRLVFQGTLMTHHSESHAGRTITNSGLSSNGYLMKRARIDVLKKTGSTLQLSPAQQGLIAERIKKIEAMAHMDQLKEFMEAGEFDKALESARQAAPVLGNWKLHMAMFGLRHAPRLLRAYYRAHERALMARNRRREAESIRRLNLPEGAADARLASSEHRR